MNSPKEQERWLLGSWQKVLWDKELEKLTVEYETGWMLVVEMTHYKPKQTNKISVRIEVGLLLTGYTLV